MMFENSFIENDNLEIDYGKDFVEIKFLSVNPS